ncbi:MAG TPA: hypothetical protein VJ836_06240 [Candidatus Saccharimonadales bacterium]|nr:hypothetical protein [Candidatus Saccharimonadales bacterium]
MIINQHFVDLLSRLTPSSAENAAYASHRASVDAKLETSFNVTYTMETGSFRSGTGVRFYTDLDILASIPPASQRDNSYNMLLAVKSAMEQRFPTSTIYIRTPAVVCLFDGAKIIEITPGYYQYQEQDLWNVYKIPDFNGGWQIAAPSAHIAYVNSINNKLDKKVKHVIRLIKAIKHARNIPISSFYLELRITKYCDGETFIAYEQDVVRVLNRLVDDGLANMRDPLGISGYIEPTSTLAQKEDALSKLTTARNRARWAVEAEKAGNHTEALSWWSKVFDRDF